MLIFLKRAVLAILLIALVSGGVIGFMAYQSYPVLKTTLAELDAIDATDTARLIPYFRTKVNEDNAQFVFDWLKKNVAVTQSFVSPFLYSEVLATHARGNRHTLSKDDYQAIMTDAAIMFVFADLTAMGDFSRCSDETAFAVLVELRHVFAPEIYRFLEVEADRSTKKMVLEKAIQREEAIKNRPPSAVACSGGAEAKAGKVIDYVTTKEWKNQRFDLIESYREDFEARFLNQ